MKVVEGMKKLKIVEKKMRSNCQNITRYASMVNTERPLFETEVKQEKEVKSLVQSNVDLMKEALELKKKIERTNLETAVRIGGESYTISDLLFIHHRMGELMLSTFYSMNDTEGNKRLRNAPPSTEGRTPQVVRMYKEETRNEGLKKWQELLDNITMRLEVINATTDLVGDEPQQE